MCSLSARLPATQAECIRNAKSPHKRKTLHHRDNICHLAWVLSNKTRQQIEGKIKPTLVRISYLGKGEKPNNFPCCCREQRLLADARAVILLHIWASVTECDSEGQGEGKTRLRFSCSRMTGCRLDTRLADGISKSFHEPSGMCTMITNHITTKPEGLLHKEGGGRGQAERKGERKENQKRHKQNSVTFPRLRTLQMISIFFHREPFHSLKQLLNYCTVCVCTAQHHCRLLINSKL